MLLVSKRCNWLAGDNWPSLSLSSDVKSPTQVSSPCEYARGVASIKNRGFRAEHEIRYVISLSSSPDVVHTRPHVNAELGDVSFLKITGTLEGTDLEADPSGCLNIKKHR